MILGHTTFVKARADVRGFLYFVQISIRDVSWLTLDPTYGPLIYSILYKLKKCPVTSHTFSYNGKMAQGYRSSPILHPRHEHGELRGNRVYFS